MPRGWQLSFSEGDLIFIRIDDQARLRCGPSEAAMESPFALATLMHQRLDPAERGLEPSPVIENAVVVGAPMLRDILGQRIH